jgi:hypothetical protein
MGLLDIFGGKGPDRALKLKPKVTQKYGEPTNRQKAIHALGGMAQQEDRAKAREAGNEKKLAELNAQVKEMAPAAVGVLLERFKFQVDPATTDADEKDTVFDLICGFDELAVEPVKAFLLRSDQASSWAMRILSALLSESEVVGVATDVLKKLGAEYTRDNEKKLVLLHLVEGKTDPRIADATLPLLEDMADDVKIAALKVLGPLRHEPAREAILKLVTSDDTGKRVRIACIAALHESGFGVQGYREKVEAQLTDPFFVDKSGVVKKRG